MRTLLGLLPDLAGHIVIEGKEISKWSPTGLARSDCLCSSSNPPPFFFLK